MRTVYIFFLNLALIIWAISSCTSASKNISIFQDAEQIAQDTIPYNIAQNYFVRNDVDSVPTVIKSQSELDKYFGMAAYMGSNGEPTKINFSKNYVVAVVLPETDLATELNVSSFIREADGKTVFICDVKTGERQSYTTRPMLLAVVDKNNTKAVEIQINYEPFILLVYYDKTTGNSALRSEIQILGGEIVYDYKNFNALAVKLGGLVAPQQTINHLSKIKGVLSVQPDSKAQLQMS